MAWSNVWRVGLGLGLLGMVGCGALAYGMDITKYPEKKKAGLVKVVKTGTDLSLIVTDFDPDTGQPLPPRTEKLTVEAIKSQRAIVQKAVEGFDGLLADVEAAGKETP